MNKISNIKNQRSNNKSKKLTKRAQLLFDDRTWNQLSLRAKLKGVSVGELVRVAIEQTYGFEERRRQNELAHEMILKHRKQLKGKIDYKELINDGRKY